MDGSSGTPSQIVLSLWTRSVAAPTSPAADSKLGVLDVRNLAVLEDRPFDSLGVKCESPKNGQVDHRLHPHPLPFVVLGFSGPAEKGGHVLGELRLGGGGAVRVPRRVPTKKCEVRTRLRGVGRRARTR